MPRRLYPRGLLLAAAACAFPTDEAEKRSLVNDTGPANGTLDVKGFKGGCKGFLVTPAFSLRGNCGPPEPLNASLTSKLYFFAWVSGHDTALLRHFLVFYTARGVAFKEPGRANLVVSPLKESSHALLQEFVHASNIHGAPLYSSDKKRDAANAYLRALPAGRFLMYPDLDEFFDLPSSILDEAIVRGDGFVLGTMVDRVASDWSLPDLSDGPLWSQFPRRCFATDRLFGGHTRKWILVPTRWQGRPLQYDSSHKLQSDHRLRIALKETGGSLLCYGFSHYRFGAKSVALLRDKLAVYGKGRPSRDIYERLSGYLVDRAGAAGALSDAFQQSVQCLEQCPASPPPRTPVADRRPLA